MDIKKLCWVWFYSFFLFIYLFIFDGTLEIDGCTPTLKKSVANFLKFKEK